MSGQQLVNVMGRNTQINPMTMKDDLNFVSSLYDTGIAPLHGVNNNLNKDLFQNEERIQSMIDLSEYMKIMFVNVSGGTPQNINLSSDNYQIVVTNTNPVVGNDITVTINNTSPVAGDCIVFGGSSLTIYYVDGVVKCLQDLS